MINLPRKLVYTDRTRLADFTEENELYREIAFVLEGILRFQCNYFSQESDGVLEKNMLSIFNNGFYLSILATNDAQAMDFFMNCDKYGSAFHGVQVALVMLALQDKKSEQSKKILGKFECILNPLLMQVIHKFRSQEKTFCLDFSPCPPPANKFQVNWEEVTGNFNPDKVVKIISLWQSKVDRKKVLHRIWSAAGILQDGVSYSEACAYLRILENTLDNGDGSLVNVARYYAGEIGRLNKEVLSLKEEKKRLSTQMALSSTENHGWVRQVVDYAKNRHDWSEAKPISDMLNHLLRGKGDQALFDMVDEIELHFHQLKKRSDVNIDQAGNVFVNPQNVNNHG